MAFHQEFSDFDKRLIDIKRNNSDPLIHILKKCITKRAIFIFSTFNSCPEQLFLTSQRQIESTRCVYRRKFWRNYQVETLFLFYKAISLKISAPTTLLDRGRRYGVSLSQDISQFVINL